MSYPCWLRKVNCDREVFLLGLPPVCLRLMGAGLPGCRHSDALLFSFLLVLLNFLLRSRQRTSDIKLKLLSRFSACWKQILHPWKITFDSCLLWKKLSDTHIPYVCIHSNVTTTRKHETSTSRCNWGRWVKKQKSAQTKTLDHYYFSHKLTPKYLPIPITDLTSLLSVKCDVCISHCVAHFYQGLSGSTWGQGLHWSAVTQWMSLRAQTLNVRMTLVNKQFTAELCEGCDGATTQQLPWNWWTGVSKTRVSVYSPALSGLIRTEFSWASLKLRSPYLVPLHQSLVLFPQSFDPSVQLCVLLLLGLEIHRWRLAHREGEEQQSNERRSRPACPTRHKHPQKMDRCVSMSPLCTHTSPFDLNTSMTNVAEFSPPVWTTPFTKD